MEGERRREEIEMGRKEHWYLGVMMTAEGRMLREERKDSIGKLDARLFDFDDESDREELPCEGTHQEGVPEAQTTENICTAGEGGNERPEEAKRWTEGGVGGGTAGGQERGRSDSVDTLEGEEAFDNIISGLVNALGGIEVETDGEMEAGTDGAMEAGTDGEMEAKTDRAMEVETDGAMEAGTDGAMEAGTDGAMEVEKDGAMEAGTDGVMEAGTDGAMEAGMDEAMEVETDGVIEAEMDGVMKVGTDEVMEGETDGEVVMGERERDKNCIIAVKTRLNEDEFVDEPLLDKMLMLGPLSDPKGPLDETRVKPEEKAGGKEEDAETERGVNASGNPGDVVVERGPGNPGGKEELAKTGTCKSPLSENLDERGENVSGLKEEPRKRVEKGADGGREKTEQTSEKESKVLGEGEGERSTDRSQDTRVRGPEESAPSVQEEIQSALEIHNRSSAVSLRSITTEVLRVLNATEDLLQGMGGVDYDRPPPYIPTLCPSADPKRLDEQLSRLEENVYVAASAAYGLEAELGDLEDCAQAVSGATPGLELSFLEEQVASAAVQVHQSDLLTQPLTVEKRRKRGILPRVSDIAARITALKNAGLNVVPHNRFSKPKKEPKTKKPNPD